MKTFHPIKTIRCLVTPPCSECANSSNPVFNTMLICRSQKYLKHKEKISGNKFGGVDAIIVRGTRFCTFEKLGGDE